MLSLLRTDRISLAGLLFAALVCLAVAPAGAEVPASEALAQDTKMQSLVVVPGSEEEVLLGRADAYWTARVKRDAGIRDYYVPVEMGGPRGFPEGGAIRFNEYDFQSVSIDGDMALIRVKVRTSLAIQKALQLPDRVMNPTITEAWLKLDGTWYKKEVPKGLSKYSSKDKAEDLEKKAAAAAQQPDATVEGTSEPSATTTEQTTE